MSVPAWKSELSELLPMLGHRNWIAVVDSAYPLQIGGGIRTLVTYEELLVVAEEVQNLINASRHVRATIRLDDELRSISDEKVPGIDEHRKKLNVLLEKATPVYDSHEDIIYKLHQASMMFACVVLKTKATLPYSSVFFELECKYWDEESERGLVRAVRVE